MASHATSFLRMFTRKYVFALGLLGLIALSGLLILKKIGYSQENDARIINEAGRQRMFSQRLTQKTYRLASLAKQDGHDEKAWEQELRSLGEEVQAWTESHRQLKQVVHHAEWRKSRASELFEEIEENFQAMNESLSDLLEKASQQEATLGVIERAITVMRTHESHFLQRMNAIVGEFEAQAKRRQESSVLAGYILSGLIFCVLLFVTFFVFRPVGSFIEQALTELDSQRGLLEMVISGMSEGVLVVDSQGKVILQNEKSEEIFGTSLLGTDSKGWATQADYSKADEGTLLKQEELPFILVGQGQDIDRQQLRMKVHSSERESFIEVSGRGLYERGKVRGGVMVVRDITEERQKSKELELAKEQAEQAAMVKSRFLASMSHEIRTPMNAILSCVHLLLESAKDPEELRLLHVTQSSGNSLLALLNNILNFSKIESGSIELESEPFSPSQCLNEVMEMNAIKAAEKRIRLSCEIGDSLPSKVLGDHSRLQQVLLNLVSNALKFTQSKVHLSLTLKRSTTEKCELLFTIEDNGEGVSLHQKDKLFGNFQQGDDSATRRYGGAGLGLSMSKALIEKMGGKIWFESRYGKGASFFFTVCLPVAERKSEEESEGHLRLEDFSEMGSTLPLRILLAEDNLVNQMVTRKLLARLGYKIEIVNNGAKALEAVMNREYDLIFMDQHMPEMGGVEAAQLIRQLKKPQPKIVALTASGFKEDRERCFAAGMDGFLTKPIQMEEVIMTLKGNQPGPRSSAPQEGQLIDMGQLQEQFAGDSELIAEVAEQFSQCVPLQMEKIEKALSEKDGEELEESAHALKGMVANFYADEVVDIAFQLERMGREKSLDQAAETFARLAQKMKLLQREIDSLSVSKAA